MSSQSESSPTNALFWRLKCTFMAPQRGRSPTFTLGLGPPTASSSHHFYPIPAQQRQYWPISEVASLSRYGYLIGAVDLPHIDNLKPDGRRRDQSVTGRGAAETIGAAELPRPEGAESWPHRDPPPQPRRGTLSGPQRQPGVDTLPPADSRHQFNFSQGAPGHCPDPSRAVKFYILSEAEPGQGGETR